LLFMGASSSSAPAKHTYICAKVDGVQLLCRKRSWCICVDGWVDLDLLALMELGLGLSHLRLSHAPWHSLRDWWRWWRGQCWHFVVNTYLLAVRMNYCLSITSISFGTSHEVCTMWTLALSISEEYFVAQGMCATSYSRKREYRSAIIAHKIVCIRSFDNKVERLAISGPFSRRPQIYISSLNVINKPSIMSFVPMLDHQTLNTEANTKHPSYS